MEGFDFNTVVERRGSCCYKWDSPLPEGVDLSAEQRRDIVPMWVADMDFPVAPCVQKALEKRVSHGVFGYVKVPDSFYYSIKDWFEQRHGTHFEREWMLYTTGVVPAISASVKALTSPGDGVIVQTPVYNCFFSSIRNSGCRVVASPLRRLSAEEGSFSYEMDFDSLEELCSDPSNKILLLCNPHNPAGRLWRADELRRAGEIALRHGVIVISDEIHCEIVAPGSRYVPFSSLGEKFCHGSITLLSPSKSFNFAGLKMAAIVCYDPLWKSAIDRVLNIYEICDVNPFGHVAVQAAYTPEGARWLDGMNRGVFSNYETLRRRFASELPAMPVCRLEATYLVWIDTSVLGMSSEKIENELLEGEQVWINAGSMYGADGYIRVNVACPPVLFARGLDRLIAGLKRLSTK